MTYRLVYSPSARQDLRRIRSYIVSRSSKAIATLFASDLLAFCFDFKTFPHRGVVRDHLLPQLPVIGFRNTVSVHFLVEERTVRILAYAYAGRNWIDDYK